MKVGDLVELSARGKTGWSVSLDGRLGIVTSHAPVAMHWEISWFKKDGRVWATRMHRKEIKHARAKK